MRSAAKRLILEVVGWTLVLVGIAALVLPGPGLLTIAAGLLVLSRQYDWARRRLAPVQYRALRGAAESVETWPRIMMSSLLALGLVACGALWIANPPAPDWWPFAEGWWLPGGAITGVTQIGSGILAGVLIGYSYRRFHGKPEAVAALEDTIDQADEAFRGQRAAP